MNPSSSTETWYTTTREPLEDDCSLSDFVKKVETCHKAQQYELDRKLLKGYAIVGYPKNDYIGILYDADTFGNRTGKFLEMRYVATLLKIGQKTG